MIRIKQVDLVHEGKTYKMFYDQGVTAEKNIRGTTLKVRGPFVFGDVIPGLKKGSEVEIDGKKQIIKEVEDSQALQTYFLRDADGRRENYLNQKLNSEKN